VKANWPHAKDAGYGERRDVLVLLQQPVGTRYLPSERSETLPQACESAGNRAQIRADR
jgi:hypothetical protein